ncbi:MAG: Asp-tRNA(Asn)/Glu-tRNA(Gln) amidotransferase subunit GatB [Anaerolineales bacterium]|nr:Asp-tRNA(Asn)/Glu-tRNA(Gln) amidotransferase subunit GatB [Anaerolineales bacterium]
MTIVYEPIIGLEVHAELATHSKMFCACPVVDTTQVEPNVAVCPVCAGMPGVLPVVNQKAVELGLRVALALDCEIAPCSLFARKNYFYPDLPKGYQISQYENPLAVNGKITIHTSQGEKVVRIRRVHLEEDTGKLTHIAESVKNSETEATPAHTLIDLNRAGVPLLEIVTEPDLHSAEQVGAYARALHSLLRYLKVNSGDMQKGAMRIEPNISIRPEGSVTFGIRCEIKNLNSFRALERSVDYEIQRQSILLDEGKPVIQETRGWVDEQGITVTQRSKEEAHDYRYFPEPDLPPLVVEREWVEQIRASLPELPIARLRRFQSQYQLSAYDAEVLTAEQETADYFETALAAAPGISPKMFANWICGELFGLLNQAQTSLVDCSLSPQSLADLVRLVAAGEINQGTGKTVLAEMFNSGKEAEAIIADHGLRQISDGDAIAGLVRQALENNPSQVQTYLGGKTSIAQWLFGQVMKSAKGQANPQVVRQELNKQLEGLKNQS